MPCIHCERNPSGESMICQPRVRTRKFVQNGTMTSANASERLAGATLIASQYANGAAMTRQRNVPSSEIRRVAKNVAMKLADSASG